MPDEIIIAAAPQVIAPIGQTKHSGDLPVGSIYRFGLLNT
jgi:hypothetical protein